ncbi:putative quinol monooxygenase [Fusobacterium canifelinum]|uniref:Antibiotic biosynthesis monooxygenase n=1 Tax=Fusobacterium canifelinum TaxID=285729 RepID=A0ABX7CCQ5_9FUSO|nr:putative quinol monooxygenase [Fusobacterium canifelinum]QQS87310.1 antibiotic biosynthesis monooxygenase [Fusobacterium canifelinum]
MLKKLLLALGILTSVSMYAVPTLNIYDFEVKKDQEASYKTVTEDYVNKTMGMEQGVLGLFAATDERDKTTSFIVEIYNDYLAFSNHTKNQASRDFKAVTPQIAEGNLNSIEIDVQIAKDRKIEQNDNTFAVYTVIDVKSENNKEFAEIIKNIAETTFNEEGTLLVYLGTDRRNPNKWCLYEVYRDIDSYLNHRSAKYFKDYITQTKDMITTQKRYELQPLKIINKGGLDYKKLY